MNEAYKNLKLSESKKREIVKNIKNSEHSRKKSYAFIIAPAFVLLAICFSLLSMQGSLGEDVTTSSGWQWNTLTEAANFKDLLLLWIVSLVFVMMAYVQFILLALKPERLMNYKIFRIANQMYGTWRIVFIIGLPFLWMIIESAILLIVPNEYVAQFFVIVLLFLNVFLIQLKIVKGRGRSSCPHCDVELTNKEILMNKKCGVCGNGRVKKVQNSIQEFIATFGGLIVTLFPLFQIHLIFIFVYALLYVICTFYFIYPYLLTYQKESDIPPPLW